VDLAQAQPASAEPLPSRQGGCARDCRSCGPRHEQGAALVVATAGAGGIASTDCPTSIIICNSCQSGEGRSHGKCARRDRGFNVTNCNSPILPASRVSHRARDRAADQGGREEPLIPGEAGARPDHPISGLQRRRQVKVANAVPFSSSNVPDRGRIAPPEKAASDSSPA
jgi:hypothetical protein